MCLEATWSFFIVLSIKLLRQFLLFWSLQMHHWRRVNPVDQSKRRGWGRSCSTKIKPEQFLSWFFAHCKKKSSCLHWEAFLPFPWIWVLTFTVLLFVLMIDESSSCNSPKRLLRQDIPSFRCICLKLFIFPFISLCFIPKGEEVLFRDALQILSCFTCSAKESAASILDLSLFHNRTSEKGQAGNALRSIAVIKATNSLHFLQSFW